MDEVRQRRPVTGRFSGAMTVDDNHASMPCSGAEYEFARDLIVIGNNRADQAAVAEARQLDCLIQVFVRQHGAHRSECFNRMHGSRGQWPLAVEQGGHEECPFFGVSIDHFEVTSIPIDDFSFRREVRNACADLFALRQACERPHVHILAGRMANTNLAERRR